MEKTNDKLTQEATESALLDLDLNRYEARVYLSLVSEGVTTAKTLSGITNIPYGKVYEVIDSLARKGFVHTLPTKPAKYKAISPRESLDKIKKTTDAKLAKIEGLLIGRLEPVFNKNKKFSEPQNSFWILNGRSMVNQKAQELVESAQKTVCILTTSAGLERLKLISPYLKAAKARGVKVYVTAPFKADKTEDLQHLNGHTCRHVEKAYSTFMAVDDKEALLIEPIPDDNCLHYGRDLGVLVSNKSFVKCLSQLYELGMSKFE